MTPEPIEPYEPTASIEPNERTLRGQEIPTRSRFVVAFWLCSMAAVLYLDRVCWAKAAPLIQDEFGLSNQRMAYLAMAFQLAYGLFEIPTGRWGELIGARRVLTRITLWWSAFTALSGAASGYLWLLIIRFLFGVGEAGRLPQCRSSSHPLVPNPRTRQSARDHAVRLTVRRSYRADTRCGDHR